MSAQQGIYACHITVDETVADVLRDEAKNILVFNHEWFEDFLDFTPEGQQVLAAIFYDALAVIEAVDWEPCADGAQRFQIPLTAAHVEQLHKRRDDLDTTHQNLLDDLNTDDETNDTIQAKIEANRAAAQALDDVFAAYQHATTT